MKKGSTRNTAISAAVVCNFDDYLGPEKYRRQTGPTPKPKWKCGMCSNVNPPRNRVRCKACGAVKGYGAGYQEKA